MILALTTVIVLAGAGFLAYRMLAEPDAPDRFLPESTVATVPVGRAPSAIAVHRTANKVYVANYTSESVTVIDGATNSVTSTVDLPGFRPSELEIDSTRDRLYIGSTAGRKIKILNTTTDEIIDTVTVGDGPFIAADQGRDTLHTANNRDLDVTSYNAATGEVRHSDPIGTRPYSISFDPKRAVLYVVITADKESAVAVVDSQTLTVVDRIPLGTASFESAYDPISNNLFVANTNDDTVTLVDMNTRTIRRTIPLGTTAYEFGLDPYRGTAFVGDFNTGTVFALDARTGDTVRTYRPGTKATAVAVDTDRKVLYVADQDSQVVHVMR
ncbi:YncE family protein [Tsukamurella pseudospumae]|uniref:SMP-30/Gluconolactonase/LRE-like region domain-containing protein n=1 Tax=Tsukamurella pseudospumae TaxID=239498 RepID=A0A137ZYN1_9ACTN|nr:YncE family protein [Tsukamurella pseudospumae]KXP03311.1 hypothetical protein AXK60_15850 [Tsukamurella pseudospumae]